MSKVVQLHPTPAAPAKKPSGKRPDDHQYRVSQREQIFCDIIARLEDYDLIDVAEAAEVSYSCLRNWVYGDTMSPLLNTVMKVAKAIDYEVTLIDLEKPMPQRAVR